MTLQDQFVCNYAVLRFLPYPETGEFVNLGVALHSPEIGFFDVLLESRMKRVTDFFPELDKESFSAAREAIAAELDRVKSLIGKTRAPDLGRRIFRDVVRPRESVFRFGEVRTVLTEDPKGLAAKLFAQYVSRQFGQSKENEKHHPFTCP